MHHVCHKYSSSNWFHSNSPNYKHLFNTKMYLIHFYCKNIKMHIPKSYVLKFQNRYQRSIFILAVLVVHSLFPFGIENIPMGKSLQIKNAENGKNTVTKMWFGYTRRKYIAAGSHRDLITHRTYSIWVSIIPVGIQITPTGIQIMPAGIHITPAIYILMSSHLQVKKTFPWLSRLYCIKKLAMQVRYCMQIKKKGIINFALILKASL